MAQSFTFTDNTGLVLTEIGQAAKVAMTKSGLLMASATKALTPVDTGATRDSFEHHVEVTKNEATATIGSGLMSAVYNEYGTGEFAEQAKSKGYWIYVPGSPAPHKKAKKYSLAEAKRIMAIMRSNGIDAHITNGLKPKRMLRTAFAQNWDKVRKIVSDELGSKVGR